MTDTAKLQTRAAAIADAAAIAEIYNHSSRARLGLEAGWFAPRHLVVVAETKAGPVAFATSFPHSNRPCYRGISVYVRRDQRGRGAGRTVLAALIEAAEATGLRKLTGRVFPENAAGRALLKGLDFEEIGLHRRHGQLDGRWRDCVIVEPLRRHTKSPSVPSLPYGRISSRCLITVRAQPQCTRRLSARSRSNRCHDLELRAHRCSPKIKPGARSRAPTSREPFLMEPSSSIAHSWSSPGTGNRPSATKRLPVALPFRTEMRRSSTIPTGP